MVRFTRNVWCPITLTFCTLLYGCSDSGENSPPADAKPKTAQVEEVAPSPPETGPLIAYRGATLIDGTGAEAIENATILVQRRKILAAGVAVDIPEDVEIVDVTGKWIVPGLIDAHVHFMTSGRIYTRPGFYDLTHIVPYIEEIEWIKANISNTLRSYLCAGVTSVTSLGGPSLEYNARELARSMDDAPTVFIGHGVIVNVPNFIAENVIPPWDGEMTIKPTTSEEAAIAIVQDAIAKDAELMKIAVDDRDSMVMSLLQWGWESVQQAVIEEAAKNNMNVTGHIHALEPARKLIELGISSLQHLPSDEPVDEAFITLAREKGIIVAPTLGLWQRTFVELFTKEFNFAVSEKTCGMPEIIESWYEELPAGSEELAEQWRAKHSTAIANTKALYEGGVKLAVGSDTGLMGLAPGPSLHLELRAMNEAGIPPAYLITAATLHSASVAGKDAEYGSIEAGKFADFLILSKDPLEDIANLQAIDTIVKHGKVFEQQTLLPPSVSK
ncbi:MAG: amidohydrolase family protein [Pseudomonadota bacterium]